MISSVWSMSRRFVLWLPVAALAMATPSIAEEAAWEALKAGAIVLFRHANAPGTGDPPNFMLRDCSTQRNLDEAGRLKARDIGEAFTSRAVAVGQVMTSQWCRSRDTAQLAFGEGVVEEAAFNSFFQDRSTEEQQTAAARAILLAWRGPTALVVVTHQVNITALTGIVPAQGEGIVLRSDGSQLELVGRIKP